MYYISTETIYIYIIFISTETIYIHIIFISTETIYICIIFLLKLYICIISTYFPRIRFKSLCMPVKKINKHYEN